MNINHSYAVPVAALIFIVAVLLVLMFSAVDAARAPQPGLQVQLITVEGMTCVAVYTLNKDTGHEFAPIAGVSCNWDEYDDDYGVWVTR